MRPDWWPALVASTKQHEGLRLKPYRDSVGVLTIGYGRNLEDVGITREEAERMLERDLAGAYQAVAAWEWFADLSPARQQVLVEMAYNLGLRRLMGFGQMLAACKSGRYQDAADEMLQSRWAGQVGARARTLAETMRRG